VGLIYYIAKVKAPNDALLKRVDVIEASLGRATETASYIKDTVCPQLTNADLGIGQQINSLEKNHGKRLGLVEMGWSEIGNEIQVLRQMIQGEISDRKDLAVSARSGITQAREIADGAQSKLSEHRSWLNDLRTQQHALAGIDASLPLYVTAQVEIGHLM